MLRTFVIGALALGGMSTPAFAYTLDFDGAGTCAAACSPGDAVLQSYGDVAGQLDMAWDGDAGAAGEQSFQYWNGNYSGHDDVAYGAFGAEARIFLLPESGYEVTLEGFFLGAYNNGDYQTQVTVSEIGGGDFLSTGGFTLDGAGQSFSGPWSSTAGVVIGFGPDANNVGIDDIVYSVAPASAAVPLPAGAALLAGALAGGLGLRRRRRG